MYLYKYFFNFQSSLFSSVYQYEQDCHRVMSVGSSKDQCRSSIVFLQSGVSEFSFTGSWSTCKVFQIRRSIRFSVELKHFFNIIRIRRFSVLVMAYGVIDLLWGSSRWINNTEWVGRRVASLFQEVGCSCPISQPAGLGLGTPALPIFPTKSACGLGRKQRACSRFWQEL